VLIAIYTMCKSSVSVTYTFTLILLQCIYIFLHLHKASVNVFGRVSVNTKIICEVTLSLSLLSPKPCFQGYPLSKEIWLNLGMKCWNSALSAEGSRLNIVALQVGAVKIHAATVEALKKKERQGETEFTTKTEHQDSGFWYCCLYFIDNLIIYF
jgi:hypothetical protein